MTSIEFQGLRQGERVIWTTQPQLGAGYITSFAYGDARLGDKVAALVTFNNGTEIHLAPSETSRPEETN